MYKQCTHLKVSAIEQHLFTTAASNKLLIKQGFNKINTNLNGVTGCLDFWGFCLFLQQQQAISAINIINNIPPPMHAHTQYSNPANPGSVNKVEINKLDPI